MAGHIWVKCELRQECYVWGKEDVQKAFDISFTASG